MSVAASAGAVAWVVPEILTAKPAAGATLSGSPTPTGGSNPTTSPQSTSTAPGSTPGASASPATTPGGALAFTGVDLQRDAEIGAALIAGGWAMHHWASRTPKAATATEAHEAGSRVDPT